MSYLNQFNYQISGEDSPKKLVFLHGLMGSGANWRKITNFFPKNEWQVLTFDQRGHGRSYQPAVENQSGYQPEDYANDLLRIIDELGWKSIYLVGHSMGGRNALNFAYAHPDRVKALVIEDIGPQASHQAQEKIQYLLDLVPIPFKDKRQAREFFNTRFASLIPENPRAQSLAQYFYTNIEEKPEGGASWRFSKPAILASVRQGRSKDRWEELEGLLCPTLVIRGGDSDELTSETYEKMLDSNPRLTGRVISGAGHWVHFDQADEFGQALLNFFASTP